MKTQATDPNVIPFQKSNPFITNDRPLMLSDLFLFICIAIEAARDEGVPFEAMLAEVVLDELQGR